MEIPAWPSTDRDTLACCSLRCWISSKKNGHYSSIAPIIDYASPESYDKRELTDYRFDFEAYVNPGSSEGFMSPVVYAGSSMTAGKTLCQAGCFKTLENGVYGAKLMGELSGLMVHLQWFIYQRRPGPYTRTMNDSMRKTSPACTTSCWSVLTSLFTSHPSTPPNGGLSV